MIRALPAALLFLSACAVPDDLRQWNDGCDYSQLAGKTAIVSWTSSVAGADSACQKHPQYAGSMMAAHLGCTIAKPVAPQPGFDNDLWKSIDGVIVTTPEAWVALHESCHLALGPKSRNHPPHDGGK